MTNERELLANLIPLGFEERDGVRNVLEAADRIIDHGFHLGNDADALATARARAATYRLAIAEALEAAPGLGDSNWRKVDRMIGILERFEFLEWLRDHAWKRKKRADELEAALANSAAEQAGEGR